MADIEIIGGQHSQVAFDAAIDPVAVVEPGSIVRFEVDDAMLERLAAGESPDEIGHENLNTVTGPVAIRGAEPGDAVCVEVLDVQIARAWAIWLPGFGPLAHRTTRIQAREIELDGSGLRLGDGLRMPIEPMIGCIGLAPAHGRGSTMRPTYPFGGNMDLRELSPGANLWLPVQVSGGLLSLGDLHAAMGHGEPAHLAIEAGGSATIRIELEKNRPLGGPRVLVGQDTICIGMDDAPRPAGGIGAAYHSAVNQAYELLTEEFGLEPFDAYAYICARVATRFGGPAGSLVLAVVPHPRGGRGTLAE